MDVRSTWIIENIDKLRNFLCKLAKINHAITYISILIMNINRLSPLILFFLSVTFVSCDDERVPDYSNQVVGVYQNAPSRSEEILVERIGESELKLSNKNGTILPSDLTVDVISETDNSLNGVSSFFYTTSDSNISFVVGKVSILGQEYSSSLEIKNRSFKGVRE